MTISRPLKRIGTVAGTLSAAILLTITQASAVSAETERATALDGPASVDSWECTSSGESASTGWDATGCYSDLGDWFYIYDGTSDGYSAVVDWEIRDGSNNVVRYGAIFNADGAGAVRYKNKDFPDGVNDTIRFHTCLGHWSTKLITAGTCSAWMTRET
ncbi:hypothetical protein [Streptomyces sp. NBC_01727]|uniref:hypothetical protein n=1 Tax=Streptomyces sp. NBC_01727 TaxID=2975924 RepID=UPI002E0D2827|nr:hypothetical protein OIE76_13560 [Streptomyces sp. NBC_01727]